MRMPAEFEPHAATWLAWPHNPETWPGCLAQAEDEFEVLVDTLAASEPIELLTQSERDRDAVAKRPAIAKHLPGALTLHVVETDDSWLRDIGPTFVHGADGLVALDWTFNAWGGKYPPWERDDAAAAAVSALAQTPTKRAGLVLEGGALDVDGDGTLLATVSSLLSAERSGLDAATLEARLGELIGVWHTIWLEARIAGDDTDGHIDNIARFVAPSQVVCAVEGNPADPNAEPLAICAAELRASRDALGRELEVIDLPMPEPVFADGERLPASHANFYIANTVVAVPVFGGASDREALDLLGGLFPTRQVVPIPSRALVRGLGAAHCLTQQQPRV